MIRKLLCISLLLCITVTVFAGCDDASDSSSVAGTSSTVSETTSEDLTETTSSEASVSEDASSEPDQDAIEWDFQKDWPVYVGAYPVGAQFVPLLWEENLQSVAEKYAESDVNLLHHVAITSKASVDTPENFSTRELTDEEWEAFDAYLKSLGLSFEVCETPGGYVLPLYKTVYHADLSWEDMKNLTVLLMKEGYFPWFEACEDCPSLAEKSNTWSPDVSE